MAASQVIHGAIAIVRVNGTPIGRMRNVRYSETYTRADVRGLGTIFVQEAPVTAFNATLACSFYEIDFTKSGIPGAVRRDVQTNEEFQDQLVHLRDGVQVDIFKKIEDIVDPNTGLIRTKVTPYAICKRCLIEGDNIDITEGTVSGRDQSFRVLDPIVIPA